MLRRVAKAALFAMPRGLRNRLHKAYLWNARSYIYDDGIEPDDVRRGVELWHNLAYRYGALRAWREGACVDADGAAIPWYSYPAMEFIRSLDVSRCRVFEFGAGNSTRFWAARALSVDAVEMDPEWHARVAAGLPEHAHVHLARSVTEYVERIRLRPEGYDVIVVDGTNEERGRERCAAAAIAALRPGGMIVLDDSLILPRSRARLRAADLIEVPMSGLAPLNTWTGTTSIFLRRDFAIPPADPDRSYRAIGSPPNLWEGEPQEIVLGAPSPPFERRRSRASPRTPGLDEPAGVR